MQYVEDFRILVGLQIITDSITKIYMKSDLQAVLDQKLVLNIM